ncbi:hypothetical protein [Variovorax sp. GT1P44]|uniref:hypothetical protein n=1 Tax=Variovorax sp. GT1P44 TaxID=3443742 RepID=UPI003F470F9F
MFNLLVSGIPWNDTRDTMGAGRVFEHTEARLVAQFQPAGVLDIDALMKLPALFMQEGRGAELRARVGTLTRVRLTGRDYQLEYAYDTDVAPIFNNDLVRMAPQLGIEDWEFARTHWAVKEGDLYRELLRAGAARTPGPRVFRLSENPPDQELVSVMMPFSAEFTDVYTSIRGAVEGLGKTCSRADNIWNADAVIQDVVSLICDARVVICDLSGRNANVFYEAGIAHALGKEVILITQSAEDVPFDLRHLRFVQYLNNGEGRVALAARLSGRLETLFGT